MQLTNQIKLGIGNFSEILGVHQRTLRIWDKENILQSKRTPKNRRYYTTEDVEKGKLILFLTRNLALNLTGTKILLRILNDKKVNTKESIEYLNNLVLELGISTEVQEENVTKTSRRGRKKTIKP